MGTLIIGATIVMVAFIGRVKIIALIVLIPNIVDMILKFYSAGVMERQKHQPTQVSEDGKLMAPETGFNSLFGGSPKNPCQKNVVIIVWLIGIFFGAIGIFMAYILKSACFK